MIINELRFVLSVESDTEEAAYRDISMTAVVIKRLLDSCPSDLPLPKFSVRGIEAVVAGKSAHIAVHKMGSSQVGEPVKSLPPLKVGDTVTRYLAGEIRIPMVVTKVTGEKVTCQPTEEGLSAFRADIPNLSQKLGTPIPEDMLHEVPEWDFDPVTGAEIDEYLNFGPPPKKTGSYIVKEDS